MARKQQDMWSMINRELAKIESTRGGRGDPYVEAFTEAMAYGTQQKERQEKIREERSDDAMKIMALQAGDYGTNYDNASLDTNIKRLENYMAKNKGKLDVTAMDYYDITLNGLKDQKALNLDFKSYQEGLPAEKLKMNEYLAGLDEDKVWTTENVSELKKMQKGLVDYTGKFKAKHGTRLASKTYQDYNLQLTNMESTNSFLIQSALDDGYLRKDEAQAYIVDMGNGNTKESDRLRHFEDQRDLKQVEVLTAKMGEQMADVDMYKKHLHEDGLIQRPGSADPNDLITFKDYVAEMASDPAFVKAGGEEGYRLSVQRQIKTKQGALNMTDESYQKIAPEGSYVEGINPSLYEEEVIKKKEEGDPAKVKPIVSTVASVKEARKGLKGKLKDMEKLRQAEKQGKKFLDQALKNLDYESKESLAKDIGNIQRDVSKIPAMQYVENQLKKMGQVAGEMTLDKWIKANPEEWERLVNERYSKRAKAEETYKYR